MVGQNGGDPERVLEVNSDRAYSIFSLHIHVHNTLPVSCVDTWAYKGSVDRYPYLDRVNKRRLGSSLQHELPRVEVRGSFLHPRPFHPHSTPSLIPAFPLTQRIAWRIRVAGQLGFTLQRFGVTPTRQSGRRSFRTCDPVFTARADPPDTPDPRRD